MTSECIPSLLVYFLRDVFLLTYLQLADLFTRVDSVITTSRNYA